MTQLLISGVEAVLPTNFTCTVKRENPFFTKSGEYTYDVNLRMDNATNRQLYGFLHRLNKSDQVNTGRTALLVADGRVYCRGTEVVTGWTQETVTIQIVSGESELNFFMGQDRLLEDLDLGTVPIGTDGQAAPVESTVIYPDTNYCLAPVYTANGLLNYGRTVWSTTKDGHREGHYKISRAAQPYLCFLISRIIQALGYTVKENHLESTQFRYLFLVNTQQTLEYSRMFPGWTVKDFMEEVERLTGCVFVTDNIRKTCSVLLKTIYYQNAHLLTLQNVVDQYQATVIDDDGRDEEYSSSNVSYDLPDHRWSKFLRLPDGFLQQADRKTYATLADLRADAKDENILMLVEDTGRYYVWIYHPTAPTGAGFNPTADPKYTLAEVNQFCDLKRSDTSSKLSLKFTPAPMSVFSTTGWEVIDLNNSDIYARTGLAPSETEDDEAGQDTDEQAADMESLIRDYSEEENEVCDIYCAFHAGLYTSAGYPVAYTDIVHTQSMLIGSAVIDLPISLLLNRTESLRLADMDATLFQGGYQIDTRQKIVVETYDPNRVDVRQIYVVRNRRYVVLDVEETITAEGRQPRWKATLYPVMLGDTAANQQWVLTDGTWQDGGVWLDDGRWND